MDIKSFGKNIRKRNCSMENKIIENNEKSRIISIFKAHKIKWLRHVFKMADCR